MSKLTPEQLEKATDEVLEAFNAEISQEYMVFIQEENIEHTQEVFDVFQAGALSGLEFIRNWNNNVRGTNV
jgi:hypothetical protein